jgi:hypothetical protein
MEKKNNTNKEDIDRQYFVNKSIKGNQIIEYGSISDQK